MKKDYCSNKGCFFSIEPIGITICDDCLRDYINSATMETLYEMFIEAVDIFKTNRHFRQQIRAIDIDMVNDYEEDCRIFEQKMFEIVNNIMLYKQNN